MPSNIVSYYQQIGRAGRNIDRAYIFLMHGKEDEDILNYFIDTAFPTEREARQVMGIISQLDGVKKSQIVSELNMREPRIDKTLAFLLNDGFIREVGGADTTLLPKGLSMMGNTTMLSAICEKKR